MIDSTPSSHLFLPFLLYSGVFRIYISSCARRTYWHKRHRSLRIDCDSSLPLPLPFPSPSILVSHPILLVSLPHRPAPASLPIHPLRPCLPALPPPPAYTIPKPTTTVSVSDTHKLAPNQPSNLIRSRRRIGIRIRIRIRPPNPSERSSLVG